jgi:CubicO group peptidase (beta-lactamase class C family)
LIELHPLDLFVEEQMRADGPPGLAVAITDRERTVLSSTYGSADPNGATAVRPDHLFQIGSMGKSFAAFMVMQEVEAGRLRLDAEPSEYIPWLRIPTPFAPITIHHLLTHTAGITMGSEFSTGPRAEVSALTRGAGAAWPPGERFYYSNDAYKAVGLILEEVTGSTYVELLCRRLFEPLGMESTVPAILAADRPRSAVGCSRTYDDRPAMPDDSWVAASFSESVSADGSICSTSEDMAAYTRMIIGRGTAPDGTKIISRESFARMAEPVAMDPETPGDAYGYALNNRERDGRSYLGHSGGTLGFTSGMWTSDGLGVVVLQNCDRGAWWLVPYAFDAVASALGGGEPPEPPRVFDPAHVEGAEVFEGRYSSEEVEVEIVARGSALHVDGYPLLASDDGPFRTRHPELELHPVNFIRDGEEVVALVCGPHHLARNGAARHGADARRAGLSDPISPEWRGLLGHYRSHNAWASNFRVFTRAGRLILEMPGVDYAEHELSPAEGGGFVVGDTPERISFGDELVGVTQSAVLSEERYFRTFTP